jgi:flagellar biosynthesis/type III secretory pathway protein FliH
MPTWDEADKAYQEDLRKHYDVGYTIGFEDGLSEGHQRLLNLFKDFDNEDGRWAVIMIEDYLNGN